ncbi:MAG: hypothetical protein ACYTGZ_19950 [Planctomycetota bacterium]|jgi:hypothetical protein
MILLEPTWVLCVAVPASPDVHLPGIFWHYADVSVHTNDSSP